MAKEWEKYRCGEPPDPRSKKISTSNAVPLTDVYHVAHLDTAYNILRDKNIRASLIRDKSVLNKERILVTWLSPNTWGYGSRYGTVCFSYDFATIVKGCNYYWVEAIDYPTPAPRILITDKDYSEHDHLIPYDPEVDKGPWIKRGKEHFWAGKYNEITLEFMLEDDLRVRNTKELSFTKHNRNMCCIDLSTCKEKGMETTEARKRFFATVIGQRIPGTRVHFVDEEDGERIANNHLKDGIRSFLGDARDAERYGGPITSEHDSAAALALSALTFYGQDSLTGFEDILALFKSHADFKKTVHNCVVAMYRLTDDSSLFRRG